MAVDKFSIPDWALTSIYFDQFSNNLEEIFESRGNFRKKLENSRLAKSLVLSLWIPKG